MKTKMWKSQIRFAFLMLLLQLSNLIIGEIQEQQSNLVLAMYILTGVWLIVCFTNYINAKIDNINETKN